MAPASACDCHLHIYDPAFPAASPANPVLAGGTAADYRLLQQRIGTHRAVVVTPSVYRTDNRATLDAIRKLGIDRARGVAVLHPDVTDEQLQILNEGGIKGIRFTLFDPNTAATTFDMVEPLAIRVQTLGWHVQLHWRADQIVAYAALLDRLPGTLVFDHMARLPQPQGSRHEAFNVVARLIERGNAWVKLSGAYIDSREPGYTDTIEVAQSFVRLASERMVWGSDWPHPTEKLAKPDDATLFDLLAAWVPDQAARHRILVDNPARLYAF